MKKILLLSIGLLVTIVICAQQKYAVEQAQKSKEEHERANAKAERNKKMDSTFKALPEEDPLFFKKYNLYGVKINTDGYGLSYEKGIFQNSRWTRIYQVEINEKKHPKEDKVSISEDYWGSNRLIWGKTNNFYQLKLGMGEQYLIGNKGNKNGVMVSALFAGGLSLGFMKPYQYDVVMNDGSVKSMTFENYRTDTTGAINYSYAPSYSGPWKGWDHVKLAPGLHAKTALRFDYGVSKHAVMAIEAGVNVEYYFKDISQMYLSDPKKLFFNGYLAVCFGKRKS